MAPGGGVCAVCSLSGSAVSGSATARRLSAISSIASTWSAVMNLSRSRTLWSISSRSGSLSAGIITVETPARRAAMVFSFSPPMGRMRPRSVISPVMARSRLTGMPVSAEMTPMQMVMPALGPSLGTAPSGKWMWMSFFWLKCGSMPSLSARERI